MVAPGLDFSRRLGAGTSSLAGCPLLSQVDDLSSDRKIRHSKIPATARRRSGAAPADTDYNLLCIYLLYLDLLYLDASFSPKHHDRAPSIAAKGTPLR